MRETPATLRSEGSRSRRTCPDGPPRILMIEDDDADAYILERLLRTAAGGKDYAIERVDMLNAGLQRLSESGFDVLLVDLNLPDSSGLDTFRRLSASAPEIGVIILSGREDESIAVRLIDEGAHDYLVKGRFDGPLLIRAIRQVIDPPLPPLVH